MQFTRLRLNGFKSFVDPTDLVIRPGLTGVVGPNGCGKSNLLEALRWVMGENRPTAMRGGGMEDVIFAGTGSRNARHFAEVVLSLDNSDRLAPAGFNDADQIEITRRITRDAGSAYRLNGKELRARDVQMLFADASTGAHSPALVRQGQIAELINAKPRARRRILEEAAGISGLYQRRHEAELKLNGAEVNLARVSDVIDQLAAQLASLARQARQAARYKAIGADLRRAEGLLLFRRWHEAEAAHTEAEAALRAALTARTRAEAEARAAAAARAEAEAALPPLREETAVAGAILQRLSVQRDTLSDQEARAAAAIATLEARIRQLTQDITRETGLNADAGETITRLEWEASQIARATEGQDAALTEAQEAARTAAAALAALEAQLSEATEDSARLAARHQSATRQIEDTQTRLSRARAAAQAATDSAAQAQATLEGASQTLTRAEADLAQAQTGTEAAETALTRAETARTEAQAAEATAREARAEAEGAAGTLRAETAALARLVERDKGKGTALLDRIEVAPGHELALGAALGDDLRAPLAETGTSGWQALAPLDLVPTLPDGATPLAAHVTAPRALDRRLSQIGVIDPAQAPALQDALRPGQRMVSLQGDLWRWDGLHVAAADAPGTAALRLQQINRLRALRHDLEQAESRAETARAAHDTAQAALAAATQTERHAREARRASDRQVTEARRALSQAEASRDMATGKLDTARQAQARHAAEAAELATALTEAETARDALPDTAAARARLDTLRAGLEEARNDMLTRRARSEELRRDAAQASRRQQEITAELKTWRQRLQTASARIADLETRKAEAEAELTTARAAPGELAAARAELQGSIQSAETRLGAAQDSLAAAESALARAREAERSSERQAGAAREDQARAETRRDGAAETLAAAAERISEALDATPAELLDRLQADPDTLPDTEALEAEAARLR
ncbi:AAA family ATPase, partial [Rhodobacteraceae bacterium 2376]